jgi:hypothetical protein
MTDAEKIEQVEHALDGTRELIAEVRELAGTFSYVRRTGHGELATLDEFANSLAGLLDRDESALMHRAEQALGPDALYKVCAGALEEYDCENPHEYRRDYVRAVGENEREKVQP